MEVKINKDIRDYYEIAFWGLSMWQFFFCLLGCAAAVAGYFAFRDVLGTEAVSWVCILCAFPFMAIGFIKYNGMTANKLLWAWIKSVILTPKYLVCRPVNIYHHLFSLKEKGRGKKHA